ncbi:RES domain-containing protein [Pontibacter sp. FD36]|uniref:RES domain-containing protein n=1 Tax=Pontibacter sp. FD36 TaxID=2789860 RepID=UPI0018AADC90|nr:RES domain-containing protein [Pontibacter sp. FD36]MBF8962316.1 RES domain-containing protein [Pontibacter sp. FD36]
MIDKIANNETNKEELNLHPTKDILEKLNYYRSLFGKVQDLTDDEFDNLKQDVAKFFNLKIGGNTQDPPQRLVRISNNNKILAAQGKELSYLTDISQLLAPPIQHCGFGRCNIPKQQVLYCATTEAGAYWEIKPKHGDVITLSHYELKPNAKVNCVIVTRDKTANPEIQHQLQEVYYILEDFFVDAYSLEVDRSRPRDYLFSALLSSEQLFYPVVADNNFEAIIYPSVQKKKFGDNFAIRNELILERYNLIGVETRFILDEYENLDPASDEVTTDQVIGSFGTTEFDFKTGEILYNEKADEIFKLFRMIQTGPNKQVRYEHEGIPKNLAFNLSPKKGEKLKENTVVSKIGRNDRINVVYQNGTRKDNIKYKTVKDDIISGKCRVANY